MILDEIASLVSGARRVLLIAHVMPDADTIGSALGLAWALRARGIEARLSCADPLPPDLRFIPGSEGFAARTRTDEELVFAIDASDPRRLGEVYDPEAFATARLVNIDHHVTNTQYGDLNLVADRSSTAELIYEVVRALGVPLDARIATCLLAGLVSDTCGFRTTNTTADSLRTAVALMEAGASLTEVSDGLFNHRSLDILPLWGAAFAAARVSGEIVWTEVTQDLLRKTGVDISAADGLANFFSTLDTTRVAVVFLEVAPGRFDVNLRSSADVDVSGVALALGGGGHPQAAGCQLDGSLAEVRERVLAALQEALQASPAARTPS